VGELFTIYAAQVLAPTLAAGDIVILDNLGSHKGKAAHHAIRAKGAIRLKFTTRAFHPSTLPLMLMIGTEIPVAAH
jgi:hypothetical protein